MTKSAKEKELYIVSQYFKVFRYRDGFLVNLLPFGSTAIAFLRSSPSPHGLLNFLANPEVDPSYGHALHSAHASKVHALCVHVLTYICTYLRSLNARYTMALLIGSLVYRTHISHTYTGTRARGMWHGNYSAYYFPGGRNDACRLDIISRDTRSI